ncbi:hypothetical protein BLA29_013813, partial [Euroglyphus maynei]
MKRVGDMLPQQQSTASDTSSTATAAATPSTATTSKTAKTLTEQFLSTVQSPQFQQALNSFSHALQSGQLGPLMQQFGLSESCVNAANNG